MACTDWVPRWLPLLYGEASPEEAARAEAHLAGCSSCREEFRALGEVRTRLRESAPSVPPAPHVVVLESRAGLRPSLAFAAGVLLAALVGFVAFAGGRATAPGSTGEATASTVSPEAMESVVRAEVERRVAETLAAREAARRSDWSDALVGLEHRLETARRSDLDYLLARIAASDRRTDGILDETQRALQYVALGANPAISPR